jgi:uncharacterized protein YjbJ (UPF0337 family)
MHPAIAPSGKISSTARDQVEAKFHEMKNKVKEKTGQATINPDSMDEGTAEKVSETVPKKIGQVENVFAK